MRELMRGFKPNGQAGLSRLVQDEAQQFCSDPDWKRNKARIAFPWPTYAFCWLLGVLPPAWTDGLLRRGPRKS